MPLTSPPAWPRWRAWPIFLVDRAASSNLLPVSLETGVNGQAAISTNAGSAPGTLSRSVPSIYTAQAASSVEIRVAAFVGVGAAIAEDEVVKVPARSRRHFHQATLREAL